MTETSNTGVKLLLLASLLIYNQKLKSIILSFKEIKTTIITWLKKPETDFI